MNRLFLTSSGLYFPIIPIECSWCSTLRTQKQCVSRQMKLLQWPIFVEPFWGQVLMAMHSVLHCSLCRGSSAGDQGWRGARVKGVRQSKIEVLDQTGSNPREQGHCIWKRAFNTSNQSLRAAVPQHMNVDKVGTHFCQGRSRQRSWLISQTFKDAESFLSCMHGELTRWITPRVSRQTWKC